VKLHFVIAWMALWLSLCFGQQKAAPTAKPDDGRFSDGVYTNSYFGLSYQIGQDWFVNDEMTTPEQRAKFNRVPGAFLLTVVDRHTGTPRRERILLLTDQYGKYTDLKKPRAYVERHLKAQDSLPGVRIAGPARVVQYSGRQFYRGDYTATEQGMTLYKSYACTQVKGFYLCWTFVSSSEEKLNSLFDTLKQAKFTP
jgi:hypothetical protein